jgi:hypothetical protein
MNVWTFRKEVCSEFSAGVNQVLAIVENKQKLLCTQIIHERDVKRASWRFSDTQHCCHALVNKIRILKWGEFDQPGARRKNIQDPVSNLQRQPGFTNTANAC